MNVPRRRAAILAVTAMAVSGLATLPISQAASAAPTNVSHIKSSKAEDGGYVSVIDQPDGTLEVFSTSGPVVASTSGQVAKHQVTAKNARTGVLATTTEYSDGGELTVNDGGKSFTTMAAQDVSSVTALEDIGVSPSDAAQFSSLDTAPTSTVATAKVHHFAVPNSTPVNNNQLRDLTCINKYYDGSQRVHLYGCDRQYLVWVKHPVDGTWGLEDKFLATGISNDQAIFNPDEISGVKFGVHYPSGNTIDDYAPINTFNPKGDCYDRTFAVTYKDVTVSEQGPICKASFGPVDFDHTHFATKWDGQGNGVGPGVARSATGVDDDYNPSDASPDRNVYWHIWWV